MSTLLDIFTTVQSAPHGGSTNGMSKWGKAATCGRLSRLSEQQKEAREANGKGDLNPLDVGTYYHALHEVGSRGQLDSEIWDCSDEMLANDEWMEAVRLYRAYVRDWESTAARWGAIHLGAEVKIPATPKGEAMALECFGEPVTGRMDALIEVTNPDIAEKNTGLKLQPGVYILDHKTAASRKDNYAWEFGYSLQAASYLQIYNMENPERPALGFIFDQIFKHADISKVTKYKKDGSILREPSYQAYLTEARPEDVQVIQALVRIGRRNYDEDLANPNQCFKGWKPCYYFTAGYCKRF